VPSWLAARSEWQWQELALEEKLDGRQAAWHMRRLALGRERLAARDEVRSPARQSVDEQSQRPSTTAYSMFLDYAENARPELARTTGANDFMKAAQDTMAVVRPTDGKPRSEFAALGACRRWWQRSMRWWWSSYFLPLFTSASHEVSLFSRLSSSARAAASGFASPWKEAAMASG